MEVGHYSPRKAVSRRQMLGLALGGSLLMATAAMLPVAAQAYDPFVTKCGGTTPSINTANYPGASRIILSNNLARPTGKALDAPGQLLHIAGRVTDEHCVPIAHAIIDLWQTNPFGQYRWATRDELLNPEPIFAGNGRAVTDNMGRYQFTTLFPAGYGRYAPHVNLRISHPDFSMLNTVMYFRGDHRNDSDTRFKALRHDAQDRLLADVTQRHPALPERGLTARYDIVVKGNNTYRRY